MQQNFGSSENPRSCRFGGGSALPAKGCEAASKEPELFQRPGDAEAPTTLVLKALRDVSGLLVVRNELEGVDISGKGDVFGEPQDALLL